MRQRLPVKDGVPPTALDWGLPLAHRTNGRSQLPNLEQWSVASAEDPLDESRIRRDISVLLNGQSLYGSSVEQCNVEPARGGF